MEPASYSQMQTNPCAKAGIVSRIFLWWTYSVIKKGQLKPYDVDKLPAPLREDHSHVLSNKFEELWFRELQSSRNRNKSPSLLKVIVKMIWKEFLSLCLLHAFNEFVISIGKHLLLALFLIQLRDLNDDGESFRNLICIGAALILFYGLNNLLSIHFIKNSFHLGRRTKICLTSVIYRKCLRLGSNSKENQSAGLIVNLLSNDMRQFDEIFLFCCFIWSGIIWAVCIIIIMSYFVGYLPAIACLSVLMLTMPIQIIVSKFMAKYRSQTAHKSDARIQMMDNIICGIQIIKMYAWEKSYESAIRLLRRAELKIVGKVLYLRGFQIMISIVLSRFSVYVLLLTYVYQGGQILAETVFVLIGLSATMAKVTCGLGFRSFAECSQCNVSIKRIQGFLELEEFRNSIDPVMNKDRNGIRFKHVKANWSLDSNQNTLNDINLTFEEGELVIVIGHIGSGKSSLLNVILGELPIYEGDFSKRGTLSYYSQIPWIFSGTIKQNILFSEDFEQSRYDRVVDICALNTDFKHLEYGDHTLIGDRGVTLSGGQKARIALARAIYKRADIYLLDDPLSAVDAHVGNHIFEKVILDFLKGTTRILVTHQLQFLKAANKVILLHEGRVDVAGPYEDIIASKANYLTMLRKNTSGYEGANEGKLIQNLDVADEKSKTDFEEQKNIELEKEENKEIDPHALMTFLMNGIGLRGIVIILSLLFVTQMIINGCEIWLSLWTFYTSASAREKNFDGWNSQPWKYISSLANPTEFFVYGYTALIVLLIILVSVRNSCFAAMGKKCVKKIHASAFHGILYTNTAFFNRNPSGRILNRFSKDLGTVDQALFFSLLDAATSAFQCIGAFIITTTINTLYLIPASIVVISLFLVRNFYLQTSVSLKRLENITKSPVLVHVHTTMQGLPIIRACSAANKLIEQFDRYQDYHTSAWLLYNFSSFGYAFALEFICFLYMVTIVLGCFFLQLSGSEIGLALAQVTILLNFIQWTMKQAAEVSNQTSSIDRLLQYANLPKEREPQNSKDVEKWPTEGRITFENVSLRYDVAAAATIYDVSFDIKPREKIGIVGRTGAGKTSLIAAIFRLGLVKGKIEIDGIDTSTVHLEKLRSSISVIPQDPILFSGTIRKNLDPFDEYNDADLWYAITQAEMKNVISKEDGAGLSTIVSEGGKNFSVGQRQLICLARAILRNNKIIVLDEATANVDQHTDSIIQKTIRQKFKECTVMTIAHRLNTIVDSDKVLVMDGGTVVEFDHPYKLLSNKEGHFYKLVTKTGQFVASALTGMARENYIQHFGDEKCEID